MRYDDIRTSVDIRYLAGRDHDGMAWVSRFRRAKRRRARLSRFLRRCWR
jgi:hypothetical protein